MNTATSTAYVFDLPDGKQALVTVLASGLVTIAFRPHEYASWGPPIAARLSQTF